MIVNNYVRVIEFSYRTNEVVLDTDTRPAAGLPSSTLPGRHWCRPAPRRPRRQVDADADELSGRCRSDGTYSTRSHVLRWGDDWPLQPKTPEVCNCCGSPGRPIARYGAEAPVWPLSSPTSGCGTPDDRS